MIYLIQGVTAPIVGTTSLKNLEDLIGELDVWFFLMATNHKYYSRRASTFVKRGDEVPRGDLRAYGRFRALVENRTINLREGG